MFEVGTRRKAVFLDRDGVLNHPIIRDGRSFAPRALDDFKLIEGAADAVNCLYKAGFLTIVVTNQKDVGMGDLDPVTLDRMHKKLRSEMPLDDIFVCTCIDECWCYKPNPGMFWEAKKKFDINLKSSFLVGDRWRDIDAGCKIGCTTIFIDWGYREELRRQPDFTVNSLSEAVSLIIKSDD